METIPVRCNSCGAALEIPPTARFVTCRYCNSQLEIKRTESSITTDILQDIDRNTASMADDLHAIRHETELKRLDQEWKQRRIDLLGRNKDGSTSTPAGNITAGVLMIIIGLGWAILMFNVMQPETQRRPQLPGFPEFSGLHDVSPPADVGPPTAVRIIFPLFGVAIAIGGVAVLIKSSSRASTYQQEERDFQQKRRQLLEELPDHRE